MSGNDIRYLGKPQVGPKTRFVRRTSDIALVERRMKQAQDKTV